MGGLFAGAPPTGGTEPRGAAARPVEKHRDAEQGAAAREEPGGGLRSTRPLLPLPTAPVGSGTAWGGGVCPSAGSGQLPLRLPARERPREPGGWRRQRGSAPPVTVGAAASSPLSRSAPGRSAAAPSQAAGGPALRPPGNDAIGQRPRAGPRAPPPPAPPAAAPSPAMTTPPRAPAPPSSGGGRSSSTRTPRSRRRRPGARFIPPAAAAPPTSASAADHRPPGNGGRGAGGSQREWGGLEWRHRGVTAEPTYRKAPATSLASPPLPAALTDRACTLSA